MRLVFRAHEWLADHCRWVQYPRLRQIGHSRRRGLIGRLNLSHHQKKAWIAFAIFWGGLLLVAAYGAMLD